MRSYTQCASPKRAPRPALIAAWTFLRHPLGSSPTRARAAVVGSQRRVLAMRAVVGGPVGRTDGHRCNKSTLGKRCRDVAFECAHTALSMAATDRGVGRVGSAVSHAFAALRQCGSGWTTNVTHGSGAHTRAALATRIEADETGGGDEGRAAEDAVRLVRLRARGFGGGVAAAVERSFLFSQLHANKGPLGPCGRHRTDVSAPGGRKSAVSPTCVPGHRRARKQPHRYRYRLPLRAFGAIISLL